MKTVDMGVAVWGLGAHALKNVVPAVRAATGVTLRGVCSRDADRVARTARDFECEGWTSPQGMLADPGVRAVYVSTPTGLHPAHGHLVLEAGRHLWCEKPIAPTLEQAAALTGASRDRGLTVAEAFMYLFHPQFARLVDAINSGEVGELTSITCRFGIPPLEQPGFRLTPELGGSAFLDVGSYGASLAAALFPGVDPDILFAEINTAPESPVDSGGRALLGYPGGVRLTLEWGIRCGYRNEIDVWGTGGSLMAEKIFSKPADYTPRFRLLDRHGRERWEQAPAANHFISMIEAFRANVDSLDAAEQERLGIERRARLLDRIRHAAGAQEN
jgi:dTDP-3,4-didehydro-2,6-dideoxy-alpha-D-glucose 3-reductase